MASDFLNSNELLAAAVRDKQYPHLASQLLKDFERANVPLGLPMKVSPERLGDTLREKVYRLILESFPDYLNLMYMVDVPETAFRALELTDVVEVTDQVVFLILKRELQKVRFKHGFRAP